MLFLHSRKALASDIFHHIFRHHKNSKPSRSPQTANNRFPKWLHTLLSLLYLNTPLPAGPQVNGQRTVSPVLIPDFVKFCIFMFRYWDRLGSLYGGSWRCDKWNIWLHKPERRNRSTGVRVNLYWFFIGIIIQHLACDLHKGIHLKNFSAFVIVLIWRNCKNIDWSQIFAIHFALRMVLRWCRNVSY